MDEVVLSFEALQARALLFVPKLIAAVVIFLLGLYLASLAAKLVDRALRRREVTTEARVVVRQLVRWSLVILAAVTALQQVNFDLTAFVAGLGVVGFTVGFALKDISENFVAGLLLLLQKPFELGDVVHIADYRGRVTDVSLRATEIITMDGQNVVLPNGMVYTNPILNYSRTPITRIAVDVGVSYDSDLDHVREVVLAALRTLPEVLEEPAPFVTFHTFADSSINLSAFYWIDARESSQFQASDLAVPTIKQAFDREGIEIPFPIRTLIQARASMNGA